MKERLTIIDVLLPGLVAGMLLGAVTLAALKQFFPDFYGVVFPPQALPLLAGAIVFASVVGLLSLLPRASEKRAPSERSSQNLTPGGPNVS